MMEAVPATVDQTLPIEVAASADCPRYLGRVIRDVDVSRPTPLYMVERLRRAGIRSIDAVVDITNYVMLELGQPLHAFDLDALEGGIRVRKAEPQERITLLDGEERGQHEGASLQRAAVSGRCRWRERDGLSSYRAWRTAQARQRNHAQA